MKPHIISFSNQMEVHYLEYLDWNVNVKCSEFASTYFQLRQPQDV